MSFPIKKYTVVGNSMYPTFHDGDVVLATRLVYCFSKPTKGHIVVVLHPKKHIALLKRITQTKKDTYFLEGDNMKESTDSHVFGWVEGKNILGRVLYKI